MALVLGALYVLRMLQKFVFGPLREPHGDGHGHSHGHSHGHDHHAVKDVNGREILAMLPLAVGCIVIGIWPSPILRAVEPAAKNVVAPYVKLIERDAAMAAPKTALATPAAAEGAAQ